MVVEDLPIGSPVESPGPESVYVDAEARCQTDTGRRAALILDALEGEYGSMVCFLDADTPFQLLIAVILSAQSTDETINRVTPDLFDAYPTPNALADAPRDHVEDLIYSTGFYTRKAEYIQETARRLVADHDGEVPTSLEELTALPGVARKTATAVLWYAYSRIEGVTVDTHVLRLANRFGLSQADSPDRVEEDLMELVDRDRWPWVTYLFIRHGRAVCTARSPACGECVVSAECPSAFTFED